jgi:hypothetical protein
MADWDRLLGGNVPAENPIEEEKDVQKNDGFYRGLPDGKGKYHDGDDFLDYFVPTGNTKETQEEEKDVCVIAAGDSLDTGFTEEFAKAWHDAVMGFDWTTVSGAMENAIQLPATYEWSGQLKNLKEDLSRSLSKNAGDYSDGRTAYRSYELGDSLDSGCLSEDVQEDVMHTSGILSIRAMTSGGRIESIGDKRGIYDKHMHGFLQGWNKTQRMQIHTKDREILIMTAWDAMLLNNDWEYNKRLLHEYVPSANPEDFSGLQRAIEEADHTVLLDQVGGTITLEDIAPTSDPFNQDSTLSKDESHTLGGGAINWAFNAELPFNVNPLEQKMSALEETVEQLTETVTGLQALVRTFINEPQKG